jgi:hypothetical protein
MDAGSFFLDRYFFSGLLAISFFETNFTPLNQFFSIIIFFPAEKK